MNENGCIANANPHRDEVSDKTEQLMQTFDLRNSSRRIAQKFPVIIFFLKQEPVGEINQKFTQRLVNQNDQKNTEDKRKNSSALSAYIGA